MKQRFIKTQDKFQKQKKLKDGSENISDEDTEAQRLSDLTQGQSNKVKRKNPSPGACQVFLSTWKLYLS